MKYLLAVLFFSLASAQAWAVSNDSFANATVITTGVGVVGAGQLVPNTAYRIETIGTTDFTAIGAGSNLVGVVFLATGVGTGTGTVSKVSTFSGSNVGATSEVGEPVHAAVGAGKSIWWAWTPASTGTATIDTSGSSFDTVLAVYTGSTTGALDTVSTLNKVAYSDDISVSNQASKVAFTVKSGTTYYIAVDGYQGGAQAAFGSVKLNVSLGASTYAAQNDNYANRAVVAGDYAVANGDSGLATIETGEANLSVDFFGSILFFLGDTKSVWWTWTAPRAGQVTITSKMDINSEFTGDDLTAVLALFTGQPTDIADLTFLAFTESPTFTPSETATLTRTVKAGEVLQIRVSSFDALLGAQITLTVAMSPTVDNVVNDRFVKRNLLSGSSVSVSTNNRGATSEPGEPAHYAEVTSGAFVTGSNYIINKLGTTDFHAIGASTTPQLGEEFTASGAGTGTGTAILLRPAAVATPPVIVNAGSFVVGNKYIIINTGGGTTDFTLIGATDNNTGTIFTATGVGSGTGTATLNPGLLIIGNSYRIESTGTTDFTQLGASSNALGTTFTATGYGSGSGTVLPVEIVPAGSFVVGRNYRIVAAGTTDFTQLGAASNAVGTPFQATGTGIGTGNASTLAASASLWWTWVAPSNGYVTLNTSGSAIDTLLKVYTGTALTALFPVASNDDQAVGDVTSGMSFVVARGTSYQIAVDTAESSRKTGVINLSLNFSSDLPVITTQVQNQTVNVTGTATFTVYNTGSTAVYDWQMKAVGSSAWVHYADTLQDAPPSVPNGIVSSTLTVPGVSADMNRAQFRCVITNVAGQVTSQSATLTVISATTYTGSSQSLSVVATFTPPVGYSIAYYAKGLPAGLTINQSTGIISGRFGAPPGTYTITYWAITTDPVTKKKTNLGNHTVVITVSAFPLAISGNFEGLLLDTSGLPAGKVELVVATTGTFTGKLTYQGKVIALRGSLTLDPVVAPAVVPTTASVALTPAAGLNLAITVRSDSTMMASLTGGLGGSVTTDMGAQHGVKLKTYTATSPAPWAGTYNLALTLPTYAALPGAGPKGAGYAFVTITPTGLLMFKGKVADGTMIAGSLYPDTGVNGTYRPYAQLYANKLGSLSGFLPLSPRGVNSSLYHVDPTAALDFYWSKVPITNDKGSYPNGFTSTGLTLMMEPWVAPTNRYLIGSLGLVTPLNSQTIGNFDLTLDQYQVGGVSNAAPNTTDSLPLALKMSAAGTVSVLPAGSNPSKWTMIITLRTGYFQGSFILADKRKVAFEGILLQLPSGTTALQNQFGQGFFLVSPPAGGSISAGDVHFTGLIDIP